MNGYIKNQIFICVKNNMHAEKYVKKYICVLAAVEPYMRRGRYAFWRQIGSPPPLRRWRAYGGKGGADCGYVRRAAYKLPGFPDGFFFNSPKSDKITVEKR